MDIKHKFSKTFVKRYGRLRINLLLEKQRSLNIIPGARAGLEEVEASSPAPYEKYSGKKKWDYKSPEDAANWIRGHVDLGVDHFVIVFPYGTEAKSIEVFMKEVAPLV